MLKQLFSEQNIKRAGINLTAPYMSCPLDTAVYHKGFFTIDAQNPEAIKKFFGPMTVEVRDRLNHFVRSQKLYSSRYNSHLMGVC